MGRIVFLISVRVSRWCSCTHASIQKSFDNLRCSCTLIWSPEYWGCCYKNYLHCLGFFHSLEFGDHLSQTMPYRRFRVSSSAVLSLVPCIWSTIGSFTSGYHQRRMANSLSLKITTRVSRWYGPWSVAPLHTQNANPRQLLSMTTSHKRNTACLPPSGRIYDSTLSLKYA